MLASIHFLKLVLNLEIDISALRLGGSWFQTLLVLYMKLDLDIESWKLFLMVFSWRCGKGFSGSGFCNIRWSAKYRGLPDLIDLKAVKTVWNAESWLTESSLVSLRSSSVEARKLKFLEIKCSVLFCRTCNFLQSSFVNATYLLEKSSMSDTPQVLLKVWKFGSENCGACTLQLVSC